MPAEPHQLAALESDSERYAIEMRPQLVATAIAELQEAGVEPDIWKVEGLETAEDCKLVADAARAGGRDDVACVVLGAGADEATVAHWLRQAATVDGFVGFAIGRTIFWDALKGWLAGDTDRETAVAEDRRQLPQHDRAVRERRGDRRLKISRRRGLVQSRSAVPHGSASTFRPGALVQLRVEAAGERRGDRGRGQGDRVRESLGPRPPVDETGGQGRDGRVPRAGRVARETLGRHGAPDALRRDGQHAVGAAGYDDRVRPGGSEPLEPPRGCRLPRLHASARRGWA